MPINVKRFDPANATPGHEGTILGSGVLPDGMKAPFWHQYGYLAKRGRAMAGHSHPTDEIYIVVSGSGYVIVGGENREVFAGDTVAIPAGVWHTMLCTDKNEAPFLWAALWWDRIAPDADLDSIARSGIHVQRFVKEKAELSHKDTILADKVLPSCIKAPFDHAYGYLEADKSMELHSHPTYEFYLVYAGEGFVTVDGEMRAVRPGDVIEIPPGSEHTMSSTPNSDFLWAAFWWRT